MDLWLDVAARERPDAAAVNGVSYRRLNAEAAAWAAALAADGVRAGDRVATTLGGTDFARLLHALPKIGAVLVPLNTRLTRAELDAVLESVQPVRVIDAPIAVVGGDRGAAPDAAAPLDDRGGDAAAVSLDDRGGRHPRVRADDVLAVVHTSGTSGRPKAVELTYANFRASAHASLVNLGTRDDDRWLCCLPLFHVGGLSILTRSAINQTEAVVHEGFDAERVARALAQERITLVSLVATQLRRLLDLGVTAPHLRAALIGGGPIPPDLMERAADAGMPVIPTYGMTETCSQIWSGRLLPGVEIDTTDDGELLVRGPMVAPGALAADGWLHTGDRGRLDAHGELHVEGRIADTIVTGGENVSAAEVEAALLSHSGIEDAAVVGRPDPEWGQAVVAFVVVRDDARAPGTASEVPGLEAHLRARLAGYKIPKRIERVAAIPRNAAGKTLRGRLPE